MKKIKTFPVLLCTMMLLFLPAQAERVNIEKAEKVARAYARTTPRLAARKDFRHSRTVSKRVYRNLPGLRSAQQQDEPVYHVFTTNGNGGFIIIAGDDVARPVLGYSDEGAFDESNKNLAYWMETLSQEIAGAIESGVTQDAQTKADWDALESGNSLSLRASGDYVDPLVKTKWNQGAPYSNLCPNKWPTGCVATAMAQIMKYHNHPAQGTGSHSYTPSNVGYEISANFGNAVYRWSDMTDIYTSTATGVAADAVATLMYHCGVSVDMGYGSGASGAYSNDVPGALFTYFGYDKGIRYHNRNIYSYTDWIDLLKTELRNNNRPVYYSGRSDAGGHAFVCDGYDTDDLFHFNWGWGGQSDGYFEVSALNPGALGIGGGSGGYNQSQAIITGIKPTDGGSLPDFQLGIESFFTNMTSPIAGYIGINYTKLINTSSVSAGSGNVGIWLCRQDKSHVKYTDFRSFSTDNPLLPNWYYYSTVPYLYSLPDNLQPGTYMLYPAYKTVSTQETPSIIPGINGDKFITVVVNSDNTVTLSNAALTPVLTLKSLGIAGNLYQNKTGNITAEIENTGTADYNSNLKIVLDALEWTNPVVIPAGTTKTVGFSGTVSLTPGTGYSLSLLYDPDNEPGGTPSVQLGTSTNNVTVLAEPNTFSLSRTMSFADANNVPQNNPGLTVTITNTEGLFAGQIQAFIFPSGGGSSLGSLGSKSVMIEQGETETILFNDPIDFLTVGSQYLVCINYRVDGGSWTALGYSISFTVGAPAAPSGDATLKTLTVKNALTGNILETVTLAPEIYTCPVTVPSSITSVSIIGEANHPRARFSNIENQPLNGVSNTFNITVRAENGTVEQTYTVAVTKSDQTYSVNIAVPENGSVTTDRTSHRYDGNETVILTVTPDTGYELDGISVQTENTGTSVAFTQTSDNTYTFTMPACNVTVTATFKKTAATLLAAAKTAVEAEAYSVTQVVANTESDVKNQLAAQINALAVLSTAGITTSAENITFSAFTPAVSGENGSFTFTARLTKGDQNITTASISGTIVAIPAYAVTIADTVRNGSIATDKTMAAAGETVTLTVTPDAAQGYELAPGSLSVYKTGGTATASVSGSSNPYTFTMPGHAVTVTAAFLKNADRLEVEAAKAAIENETYTVAQAAANTPDAVKELLVTRINSLLSGITISEGNITIGSFNGAIAGTSGNLSGTNGSFSFTVSLQTGSSTTVTAGKPDNIITATPVYAIEGSLSHGRFAANPPEVAAAGTPVTLTFTADNGYELDSGSVAVRNAGETAGGITLAESDGVYSFTMPASNVTIVAVFRPTVDQQAVEAAKAAIEGGTYTVAQAQAASAADVKTLLETQIAAMIGAGITASVTVVNFTPATAGTSGTPAGTPGSFTFTALLQSGSSTVVTGSRTGTVTATPYAGFAITVNPASHGTVSSSHTAAVVNEEVTLTVSPDPGYELNNITATSVTLNGSGNIRTFTMPAHNVTVSATFKENSDRTDVMTAKAAVEGGTYSVLQTVANNSADVVRWLSGRIAPSGITVSGIKVNSITPASAGRAGKLSGTAGRFTFSVTLEKGNSAPVSASASGTITATPAYAVVIGASLNGSAGTDKTAALAGETVTLTATPDAGYEPDRFLVYKTGEETPVFTVSGNTFTMPAYHITVKAIFVQVLQTGNKTVDSRRVWSSGGTLYITATAAGEARVFSTDGRFVKAVPHTAGETVGTALPQGFYIVVVEGEIYKVIIR